MQARLAWPGHRLFRSVELPLGALRALDDRLRGIAVGQIDAPALDGADPCPSALDADQGLDQRMCGFRHGASSPWGLGG